MADAPSTTAATIAELVVEDLASLGHIWCERRLDGFALIEDGVQFGHVDRSGALFLRTRGAASDRGRSLGSRPHPRLACWSVPAAVAADRTALAEQARQAIDVAHVAFSFGVDHGDCARQSPRTTHRRSHRGVAWVIGSTIAA